MNDPEKRVIGKVILGRSATHDADLLSVTQKEPYRHYYEADGEEFDGHRVLWSFEYKPHNYLKESELSGDEWRKGGTIRIFKDGVCVLEEFCREPDRAASRMYELLTKCMHFDHWDSVVVGHKVYHAGTAAVIDSIADNGEIVLRTEDGKPFRIYGHVLEDEKEGNFDDEWKDKDRVHVTDSRIWWWRK